MVVMVVVSEHLVVQAVAVAVALQQSLKLVHQLISSRAGPVAEAEQVMLQRVLARIRLDWIRM